MPTFNKITTAGLIREVAALRGDAPLPSVSVCIVGLTGGLPGADALALHRSQEGRFAITEADRAAIDLGFLAHPPRIRR